MLICIPTFVILQMKTIRHDFLRQSDTAMECDHRDGGFDDFDNDEI